MSLLTIAIPTYNRSQILNATLENIEKQLNSKCYSNQIEVLVSDNNSTDSTTSVCSKFEFIKYYKNKENLGMDGNFSACVERSSSKYLWILGDDENLLPNSIEYIFNSLKDGSPGCMFIKPTSNLDALDKFLDTYTEVSKNEYITKTLLYLSFLSSNVIKRDLIANDNQERIDSTNGGFLYCLKLHLDALERSRMQIILDKPVMINGTDRTAGYGFYTVFGKVFPDIAKQHGLFDDRLFKYLKLDIFYRMLLPMSIKLAVDKKDLKFVDDDIKVLENYYDAWQVLLIDKITSGSILYRRLGFFLHRIVSKYIRIRFGCVV